jgi:phosphoribosylamine-glycine ligase
LVSCDLSQPSQTAFNVAAKDPIMPSKMNSTARTNDSASNLRSVHIRPAQRRDAEASGAKRIRILIVEDEPAMVAGLRDNFEFEGYEVISADDGVAGLERALAEDPDHVL